MNVSLEFLSSHEERTKMCCLLFEKVLFPQLIVWKCFKKKKNRERKRWK